MVPAPKPGSPWENAENDPKRQKKNANFFIFEKKDEREMYINPVKIGLLQATQFLLGAINILGI